MWAVTFLFHYFPSNPSKLDRLQNASQRDVLSLPSFTPQLSKQIKLI